MIKDHCFDLFHSGRPAKNTHYIRGNLLKVDGTMIKDSQLTGDVFPIGTMIKLDHDQHYLAQNNDQAVRRCHMAKVSTNKHLKQT